LFCLSGISYCNDENNMKQYIAEFIGTFTLVFCGTGAIIINEQSNNIITHVGIAITFGLIVMAMIYTFGEKSGAHINPAVSIAFAINKVFPFRKLLPYVISQIAGAISASIVLYLMFPAATNLGETIPTGVLFNPSCWNSSLLSFSC
jgi:aquaporin NIP